MTTRATYVNQDLGHYRAIGDSLGLDDNMALSGNIGYPYLYGPCCCMASMTPLKLQPLPRFSVWALVVICATELNAHPGSSWAMDPDMA